MDCSCVYIHDYDGPTFHTEKIVRARKPHKCGECKQEIKPLERYAVAKGMWDGRLDTHKTCCNCLAIRRAFFCEGWFYGEVLQNLHDHINDVGGDISESCIAELNPVASGMVCDIIQAYWGRNE